MKPNFIGRIFHEGVSFISGRDATCSLSLIYFGMPFQERLSIEIERGGGEGGGSRRPGLGDGDT